MSSPGLQEMESLKKGGFSQGEINDWKQQITLQLTNGGFSTTEVDQYFGRKNPDLGPTKKLLETNIKTATAKKDAESKPVEEPSRGHAGPESQKIEGQVPAEIKPEKEELEEADSFLEAIEAGFDMSVSGLLTGPADMILPEDAPMYYRIASQISSLAGDIPAMMAGASTGAAVGGVLGSAAGTATLPVVGTVGGAAAGAAVGATAGAFALPAALRKTLMDHYDKGDIQDFGDFWERSSAVFIEGMKGGLVGAATGTVGGVVGKIVEKPLAKTLSVLFAEVATMTTIGRALEGEVPKATDFLDASIVIGGLVGVRHLTGTTSRKLRGIYRDTGVKPADVATQAKTDPVLRQELLSSNIETPQAFEGLGPKPVKIGGEFAVGKGGAEVNSVITNSKPSKIEVPPMKAKKSVKTEVKRTQSEENVLKRIVGSKESKNKTSLDDVYTNMIDDLHPLKQFTDLVSGKKPVKSSEDPYVLARLTRGTHGKADQMLELGTFDFHTLKNNGKSFKQVMKPIEKDLDGFRAYAVSKRTVELSKKVNARGEKIETGIELADAKAVVKAGAAKNEKVFNELQEYQNNTLKYLKDSGIISEKAFAAMTESNKSYVPFYRMLEERPGGQVAGKGLKVKDPIKAMKGSEREIIDPIESIIKNTYTYITLAERNRVMSSMVKLAEKNEIGAAYLEKVKTKIAPTKIDAKEVQKFLEAQGLPKAEALELADTFSIFRPRSQALEKNQMVAFKDGKRTVYTVDENVAKAITQLDRQSAGLFTKILSIPASTLRAGAVLTPDFMMRNLVRDQNSAFILSKNGFIPLVDSLSGLKSLFKKDSSYQNWLKSGGANSAMVSLDRNYLSKNVFKLNEQTGFMNKSLNVLKSPLEILRVSSELIENSTRLGEFKKATAKSKDANSLFNGALASKEVTLDFARMGAKTSAMNMITAFWNAHVQGIDRTARAFKENPAGMTAKVAASITAPSVALWFANHKDPRWKEIPRWQKDLFWIVMTDDHVFRIPKPFELGLIFGSMPERTLENFFTENPKALDDFTESMVQAFTPSYIPTFAVPAIEHFSNKSLFTGAPIIPNNLEGVLPEYQYKDNTSESAKILGKFVASMPGMKQSKFASPVILQNHIRAWSGNLGMYAMQTADKLLEKAGLTSEPARPADTLADTPFVKAFVIRYPSAGAQSIQDFYKSFSDHKQIRNTIRHLAGQGDFENLTKEIKLKENQSKLFQLDGVKNALTNQSKYSRMVIKNPDLDPDEKREIIDSVYLGMIETAKMGNTLVKEINKALEGKEE